MKHVIHVLLIVCIMTMLAALPVWAKKAPDDEQTKAFEQIFKKLARVVNENRASRAEAAPKTQMIADGAQAYYNKIGLLRKVSASNLPLRGATAKEAAGNFLRAHAGAFGLKSDLSDLVLMTEQTSPAGFHIRYQQVLPKSNIPVWEAQISVHLNRKSQLQLIQSTLMPIVGVPSVIPRLNASKATEIAQNFLETSGKLRGKITTQLVVFADLQPALLCWQVVVPAASPLGTWEILIDAANGKVIFGRNQLKFASGSGLVFDPNPITTSGNPALTDNADADYPALNDERKSRTLTDLDGSGYLHGTYATTAPTTGEAYEPSLTYNYLRSVDRFEQVTAYFHITDCQNYIQSTLGFTNANNRAQSLNVNGSPEDNAWYDPSDGSITLGYGGVDDGEDADVIIHEYGHSIQDNQVPGFGMTEEGGAMGEGFSDYLAASSFAEDNPAWQVYIGEWDATSYNPGNPPYLRRVDGTKHYPEDMVGEVHDDGEIWSACLWQLRGTLGRTVADKTILQSHFYLTPYAEFYDGAQALLLADQNLNSGANQDFITQVFTDRGILGNPPPAPDEFEEDDTAVQAKDIATDGTLQVHNFQDDPTDWVKFSATAGVQYRMRTSDLGATCDTILTLYGTNATTQLAQNDDYDILVDFSSLIDWTCPATGVYYLNVTEYWGATGRNTQYSLRVNVIPPAAPLYLGAYAVSPSQINLAWWDASSNETGFKIERKTGATGTWAQIATVGANVTSYASTGLTANTQYYYRACAYNAGGDSAFSNEANATTGALPAPSSLIASAKSTSQITLNWTDNSTNETGFKIERKTGATGTYALIATVGANLVTYSNTGLTVNTTYYYRIYAYNATGNSVYSNIANATPASLPAPSNLRLTAVSNTQINLTWWDNSTTEIRFKIERKTGSAGTWAQIATVGANITSYSNTGLAGATTYYYRVRASAGIANSLYSNEPYATTYAVAAPTNLVASIASTTSATLTWTDNATNETGFKIERKTGITGAYAQIATVGANILTYTDTGLAGYTDYYYRVRAYNGSGNSTYSNEAGIVPAIGTPRYLGTWVVSLTQINLAWWDAASNETGFKIERKTGVTGAWAQIATVGANVTSYANTGLTAATTYYYRVRAYNASGNSAYSNEAYATTYALNAPTSLAASIATATSARLTWVDNSTNETGFSIERKTGITGTYAQIATVGANVVTYTNTGLTGYTDYYYRVRAYNTSGNSAYTNEAGIAPAIGTPRSLTATALSNTQLRINWTDTATNETGFKIERKTGSTGAWAQIATVGANVVTYTDTGLAVVTTYYYRVRAYNVSGNSAYSNEAYSKTYMLATPTGLSAAVVFDPFPTQAIDLSWSDANFFEEGFKIERKTGSTGTWAQIATTGMDITTYRNTGLAANTQYYYRVRAYSSIGSSNYSNEANATTPPF